MLSRIFTQKDLLGYNFFRHIFAKKIVSGDENDLRWAWISETDPQWIKKSDPQWFAKLTFYDFLQ